MATVLAAAAPAFAASSASATAGAVSITLFDLNPSDGLAPSLTFIGESSASYAFAGGMSLSDVAGGLDATTTVTLNAPLVSVAGSTSPNGAFGQAAVAGGDGSGNWVGGDGQGVFSASIEVGAWTGVLIEMDYAGTATTTVGMTGSGEGEVAQSFISVLINIDGADGRESHSATRSLYASSVWDGSGYTGQDLSFSGRLRLTYANLSDDLLTGNYVTSAYAYAASAVPVPEPGTYGLMLAGLAGVAAVARRRR
jgi:hypothetical protein